MSTYNAIKYDFTPPAGTFGDMILISEQTASASASISFTSGIDSTYRTYYFKFINLHTSVDADGFEFNGSTDGGSNYDVTKTTTIFQSEHREDDSDAGLVYQTGLDIAQGTGYQRLGQTVGAGNDENVSGELWLFNPSSTTYVKHFIARLVMNTSHDRARELYTAGYFNTTSAINAIDFRMNNGNLDEGTIQMYGIA